MRSFSCNVVFTGRRKVRGGLLLTPSDRGGSSDSFGAPKTKETRLDNSRSPPPSLLTDRDYFSSPNRSLREKITDYFVQSKEFLRSRSCSPEMPVLLPQVGGVEADHCPPESPDSPPQLSDCGSEGSCGNSDSGKENEEAEDRWRGARPRADSNKMPLQQKQTSSGTLQASKQAAGRVTRSASGKLPLSLKGCENLQNEMNQADKDKPGNDLKNKVSNGLESPPTKSNITQSPPTPHKIIRVKESINPLQKLKSISLTPKKSTKNSKQAKRYEYKFPI